MVIVKQAMKYGGSEKKNVGCEDSSWPLAMDLFASWYRTPIACFAKFSLVVATNLLGPYLSSP